MPRRLSGEEAKKFAASLDDFIDTNVVGQMEAVPPPLIGKTGKPLRAQNAHLLNVKAQAAQKHFAPKKTLNGDVVAASAALVLPSAWAYQYRKLKGEPLVFMPKDISPRNLHRVRPFLEKPLNDDSQEKGYRKARQIGLSENSVTEIFWFTDRNPHTKAFYTFPTNQQMQDFSNTRISEAIQESDYLRSIMGDVKNVNLKKIGSSFLFLRGAQAERLGEGVDADVAFFDEIDRMPPRVKVAFKESLQSSQWGWVREISTPTVPNFGIDEGWNKSKQWFWFIKCSRCGTRQTLEWLPDDNFSGRVSVAEREGTHVYVCRHCEGELTLEDRFRGEWVARWPKRDPSYYQFTQMMAPWISAQRLWEKQEEYPFKQLFYNYCLGVPYLGDNILVTEEHILSCRGTASRVDWQGPRVLGIDWGDKSWIVCLQWINSGKVGLVHLERILSSDVGEIVNQVQAVKHKLRPDLMVNDAGYGKDRNTILLKLNPDRVYSCFYPTSEKGSKIFEPQWQDEQHKVSVDRTTSLKLSLGLFKAKQVIIAREVDLNELKTFCKHLTNLVSVKDYDEKTGEIEEWIASTGQDHYGHAWNYACTALGKLAKIPKSECWDWHKDLATAKREGTLQKEAQTNATPAVPGFMPIKELIEATGGMGNVMPSKTNCYALKYGYDQAVCPPCVLQKSCKKICEANAGQEL